MRSIRHNPASLARPAWKDPHRPAGTEFSETQWAAAEMANPGCVVYEIRKGSEVGLVAMPLGQDNAEQEALAAILERSVMVDLANLHKFPYAEFATVSIEDRRNPSEYWEYKVIRAETAKQKKSWIDHAFLEGGTFYLGGAPALLPNDEPAKQSTSTRTRSQKYSRMRG